MENKQANRYTVEEVTSMQGGGVGRSKLSFFFFPSYLVLSVFHCYDNEGVQFLSNSRCENKSEGGEGRGGVEEEREERKKILFKKLH